MSTTASDRRWRAITPDKGIACMICGHDHGCRVSDDGLWAQCLRVTSGAVKQLRNGMGGLHRLKGEDRARAASLPGKGSPDRPKLTAGELKRLLKQHASALSAAKLRTLARSLGVSEQALRAYGAGWDWENDAYSFPMYDGDRKPCGIRLRWEGGRKGAYPGSSNGLFVPADYDPAAPCPFDGTRIAEGPLVLLLPEGPTSSAAAYDLGFRAVGRPSATSGVDMLRKLLSNVRPRQDVAIVADHEGTKWRGKDKAEPFWPGWEGSLALAEAIVAIAGVVKVVKVRQAGEVVKDLRVFLNDAGQPEEMLGLIQAADRVTRDWLAAKRWEVEAWRWRMTKAKPRPAWPKPPEVKDKVAQRIIAEALEVKKAG